MNNPLIWLVEDEASIADTLIYSLETEGFTVRWFDLGLPVLAALESEQPAFLILDVGLPDIGGFELCRRIRAERDLPLLFLTARSEEIDRLLGLEMGADDYVGKPFDPRELVARIEAVLRRGAPSTAVPVVQGGPFCFGVWRFDRAARQLSREGQEVTLTSGEFALLNALVSNPGRPMKRERLLELTRGDDSESFDRAIDVQIHRLRRLIEDDPAKPRYLQTVWGVGYVFVPDTEATAESAQ